MPRKSTHRVSVICATCGTEREIPRSRFLRGQGRYCDGKCYGLARRTHGEGSPGKSSAEYKTWHGIKIRCLNPNAANYWRYGGRGITICDAWRDNFAQFLADVGRKPTPAHTIDRIDGNLGYQPGNVRWSTAKKQADNRGTTRMLTFNGTTQSVSDWATALGFKKTCLFMRLDKGWTVDQALTTPLDARFSHPR